VLAEQEHYDVTDSSSVANKNYEGTSYDGDGGVFNVSNTGNLTVHSSTFTNNQATGYGGAIYNVGITSITGGVLFSSNSAKSGGVLTNIDGGTVIIRDGAKFNSNRASEYGGAIYNNNGSSITISGGTDIEFSSNSTNIAGGVIYNNDNSSITINGGYIVFSSNSARAWGGVIYNTDSSEILIDGLGITFSSNSVNDIGTIYNAQNSIITITAKDSINFSSNRTGTWGGAIANVQNSSMIVIGDTITFSSNSASNGGAIYNNFEMTIKGTDIEFSSNSARAWGGAIANIDYSLMTINGTNVVEFCFNRTNGSNETGGGAIANNNYSTMIIDGKKIVFNSNNVAVCNGGAIYNNNNSIMSIKGENVEFSSNRANENGGAIANNKYSTMIIDGNKITFNSNNSSGAEGGAISNDENSTINITGENITFNSNRANENGGAIVNSEFASITIDGGNIEFNSNSANNQGGAIYNEKSILSLVSKEIMIFTGNKANGISNAIHDKGGTINLFVGENAQIIFNDRITSQNRTSTLNINKLLGITGKIMLNEDMREYTGQVNLYAGTVQIGENGTWFNGNTYIGDATINMINGKVQDHNFNNLTVSKNLNLYVDANLKRKEMDTISADSYSGEGKINVKAINILEDATENRTVIMFTSSTALKDKITTIKKANSQLYKYDVNYDKNSGNYEFSLTLKANPVIAESQVATAVGGTITQTVILKQAFTSIDNQVIQARTEAKQNNQLYASTANKLYKTSNLEKGLWIRPYMVQDTVKINGLNVDNTAIGTLAGIDFAVADNSLLSFYIGTAGSNQKYEDIKVNQTGYVLGATGMIIKEAYYLGLTANINFNKAESENNLGKDKFDMNMYSVGAKAGYNVELGKNWILEPNLTLMYGNINAKGYTASNGAKVDGQNTNNILIEPQVKAKLSLTNGWTPYALVGYVLNTGKKSKLVANNTGFDDMQISGYTEYGAGVNKSFKDSAWSCYLQVTGKSGDRKGVEGNMGVKYSFSDTIGTQKKRNRYELDMEEKTKMLNSKINKL
jgi:outer membrane autotransporter protein